MLDWSIDFVYGRLKEVRACFKRAFWIWSNAGWGYEPIRWPKCMVCLRGAPLSYHTVPYPYYTTVLLQYDVLLYASTRLYKIGKQAASKIPTYQVIGIWDYAWAFFEYKYLLVLGHCNLHIHFYLNFWHLKGSTRSS